MRHKEAAHKPENAAPSASTPASRALAADPRPMDCGDVTGVRAGLSRQVAAIERELVKTDARLAAARARCEPLEVEAIIQQRANMVTRRDLARVLLDKWGGPIDPRTGLA